ncbi:MAG TPA: DUF1801 domain-containing protein [Gemmatimonadaceae bacterium]|nr:DUF1801 domain-containing protein [Gemmatimonadaceae bacterium]
MAQSKAPTVTAYLQELPADRRAVVTKVRDVVRKNLPKGYEEAMLWGMITYCVPLKRLPDTYNQQPLCYVALAAQKNYYAIYLMSAYTTKDADKSFRDAYKATGKKLDMGKSCVRFKSLDDLPLELIGRTVAATSVDAWIDTYVKSRPKKG